MYSVLKKRYLSPRRWFMIFSAVVIAFILGELLVRLLNLNRQTQVGAITYQDHFKPAPYTMLSKSGENPYRDTLPNAGKKQNEIRIFMLGGSAVYNGEPSISTMLQEKLNQQNSSYDHKVYNLGIPASKTGNDLARLVFDVFHRQPDLVIFYGGYNDYYLPLYSDPRVGYPYDFFITDSNPLLKGKNSGVVDMMYQSALMRLLIPSFFKNHYTRLEQKRKSVEFLSESWKQKQAQKYFEFLNKAQTICKSSDIEFLACFQPTMYAGYGELENARVVENVKKGSFYSQASSMHTVFIEESLNHPLLNWVDLSNAFHQCKKQAFVDDVHTTQPAKNFMANILLDVFSERIICMYDC